MAKQQVKNHQYQIRKDTTDYSKPYFVYGSVAFSPGGESDYTVDTGVAKFPNGILASAVVAGWPNSTWSQESRGFSVPFQNSNPNIQFSVHYAGAAQTLSYKWWALGY